MARLGLERFSVVGHDRGGRVAYRMALDHPDAVDRLTVLNIVPTVDQFERMAEGASLGYWPWYFLAQPVPFAERVITGSAEFVLRDILSSWTAEPDVISGRRPRTTCGASRRRRSRGCAPTTGPRSTSTGNWTPRTVRPGGRSNARCLSTGARRRSDVGLARGMGPLGRPVEGGPLPSGHFIPEEAPEELPPP